MIFDERAMLLELRQVGAGEYEWCELREIALAVPADRPCGKSREAARDRPRKLWIPAVELGEEQALRWRGRHWELCAARRLSPLVTEVVAAPVRLSECRFWRLRGGVGADKRPTKELVLHGRCPAVLSGLELVEEGEGDAAVRPLRQRAVLGVPAAVLPEPGDLAELAALDGTNWTVRGVEPGDRENRCLLSRKVDV